MSLGPDDLLEPGDEDEIPYRRRRIGLIARAAAVLAVAGLVGASVAVLVGGSDDDRVVTDPQVDGLLTAADLAGRTFAIVAMERDGAPEPLAAQPPSLVFGDNRLQLRTGCNGMEGDFHVVDGELVFFGGEMDLRACPGTTGAQEHALFDLLLDTSSQPVEQRLHPDAHLAGELLQLRLRDDLAAWAVDVTGQPAIGPLRGEELTVPVADLLGLLARGETDDAIALWQGSFNTCTPTSSDTSSCVPGDEPTARAGIERLLREHPRVTAPGPFPAVTYGATSSPGFLAAAVTALSEPDPDGARDAAAFLTFVGPPADLTRLPSDELGSLAPTQGATVAPGDRVTYPFAPVEGGATAHVNGVEVPVEVDHDALTTSFVVPSWARGEIVVTLSLATPEVPTTTAAWYRVG